MAKIAIIGAGISGLAAGQILKDNHKVTIFEIENLRLALLFINLVFVLIIQCTFLCEVPACNVCQRVDLSKLFFLENELVAYIKLRNILII